MALSHPSTSQCHSSQSSNVWLLLLADPADDLTDPGDAGESVDYDQWLVDDSEDGPRDALEAAAGAPRKYQRAKFKPAKDLPQWAYAASCGTLDLTDAQVLELCHFGPSIRKKYQTVFSKRDGYLRDEFKHLLSRLPYYRILPAKAPASSSGAGWNTHLMRESRSTSTE